MKSSILLDGHLFMEEHVHMWTCGIPLLKQEQIQETIAVKSDW